MPSTISSRIVLSSTTLFPTPASVDRTVAEPISGSAYFELVQIPNGQVTELFRSPADDDQSTVYFYAHSPANNTENILIEVTSSGGTGDTVAYLVPNDFVYIPLYVNGTDAVVNANNTGGVTDMLLNVFWGSKGGFNL